MPAGSLSKFNIPLGFGLRKGVKLQIKNQVQQRNCLSLIQGNTLIPKSDLEVAGGIKSHSCIFGYNRNLNFTRAMATSGSVAASGDLIVDSLVSSCANVSSFARPAGQFVERNRSYRVASLGMKNREPHKSHGAHGYFIFGVTHMASNVNTFGGQLGRRYNTSSSMCYSEGGVSDGVVKESSHDESIASLAIEVDGYVCLTLISLFVIFLNISLGYI